MQLRAPQLLLVAFTDVDMEVRLIVAEGVQQLLSEIHEWTNQTAGEAFDLRHHIVEALMSLLADTKRALRHAAGASLALLGDDHWAAIFPEVNGAQPSRPSV